jgi:hypothetical protein
MKNRNLLNREYLKSFISFIRNKATTAEVANQPPRPQTNFVIIRPYVYCGRPSFKRRGEYHELAESQH